MSSGPWRCSVLAQSDIVGTLAAGATTVTLAEPDRFPTLAAPQRLAGLIWDRGRYPNPLDAIRFGMAEAAYATARTGAQFTIVRGREGTSPVNFTDTGATYAFALIASAVMLESAGRGRYLVTDYGAEGDGTTDDTAAIQAAIDAAETAGSGVVVFPAGSYLLTDTLDVAGDNLRLEGSGYASELKAGAGMTNDSYMLDIAGTSDGVEVTGLKFYGRGKASTDVNSVHAAAGSLRVNIHHCWFENLGGSYAGPDLSNSSLGSIEHNSMKNCRVAWTLSGSLGGGTESYGCVVAGNVAIDCGAAGIPTASVQLGGHHSILGNIFVFTASGGADGTSIGMQVSSGDGSVVAKNVLWDRTAAIAVGLRIGSSLATTDAPSGVAASANNIWGFKTSIQLDSGNRCALVENVCWGWDTYGIVLKRNAGGDPQTLHAIVRDNQVYTAESTGTGIAETSGAADFSDVTGNKILGGAALISRDGANSVFRDNRGVADSFAVPSIASAATIALPTFPNVAIITGTTNIDTINGGWAGRPLTLIFSGALTVGDGTGNCKLAGGFTTTADDVLELVYDGSNWVERTRSVN